MPYDRILDLMSPRGFPNLYLLGLFAKRLTVYSQQVRAINLIEAIHWYRKPLRGSNLAIVGGGVAGVTAAAMALERGARVTLFESLESILAIQNKSDRWLHPTLYDWPFSAPGSDNDRTDLPVMNWSSGSADAMVKTLIKEWEERKHGGRLTTHLNAEVTEINASKDQGKTTVRWRHRTTKEETQQEGQFDQIIFAVGFGLENQKSYWEKDSLDQSQKKNQCILIVGYGDGALTDLMRACLREFDHGNVLTSVTQVMGLDDIKIVKEIESDAGARDPKNLTEKYRGLKFPAVIELLGKKLREDRKVVLSGKGPHLFDPRASALDRLITAHLLHLEAFTHLPIGEAEAIQSAGAGDPVFDELARRAGPFTDVVLRFGVTPTITKIKAVGWKASYQGLPFAVERLRTEWDKIEPKDDPTRLKLWTRFKPISENTDHCCLLFLPHESESRSLPEIAKKAVKNVKEYQVEHLGVASAAESFKSDEQLLHTVRALCRAPVAIFALGANLGKENLGGMLLLGIRAAVRRGVTLVIHEGNLVPAEWNKLPFNLKELQIYEIDGNLVNSAARITNAIIEGFAVLRSDAQGYHDLPVFDIVRRPTRRTPNPPKGEREVFTLCSFAESYDTSWQLLKLWFDDESDQRGAKLSLKRIIDYLSPLLVGERLYELIRHAGTCVIDWTDWSPNVFFEMGVRLAVHSTSPICILRHDKHGSSEFMQMLHERFKPFLYQLPGDESGDTFRNQFVTRLLNEKPDTNAIFRVAENNLTLDDECGSRPVFEQLFDTAETIVGKNSSPNLLYDRNPQLKRQILQFVADTLLAAKLLITYKQNQDQQSIGPDAFSLHKSIESLLPQVEKSIKDLNIESAAPVVSTHEALLREVRDLKRRSRTLRDQGDYESAGKLLRKAISLLDDPVRSSEQNLSPGIPAPAEVRDMATELADCWGSLGGVLRRKADECLRIGKEAESSSTLRDAITAYKNGANLEQNDYFRIANTYNLIQVVIISILTSPDLLTSDEIKNQLRNAQRIIDRQIATSRSRDQWAYSDLGLVELLIGDELKANESWDYIDGLKPPSNVYTAELLVLESLSEVLPNHDPLRRAVERFRVRSGS
jgi:tetratricopeptide (TPR) repeat protein